MEVNKGSDLLFVQIGKITDQYKEPIYFVQYNNTLELTDLANSDLIDDICQLKWIRKFLRYNNTYTQEKMKVEKRRIIRVVNWNYAGK